MTAKRAEFHSHTVLTDGELLGIELIRRAAALGHRALAVTDHVSLGNIEWVVRQEIADCDLAKSWDILAIPGVEITHVPPDRLEQQIHAPPIARPDLLPRPSGRPAGRGPRSSSSTGRPCRSPWPRGRTSGPPRTPTWTSSPIPAS